MAATRRPPDVTMIAGEPAGRGGAGAPIRLARSASCTDRPRSSSADLPLECERVLDADRFLDACERQAEDIPAALDEEHLEQGERERKHEDDLRPPAGVASNLERATETLDVSLDGVETHASSRKLGHLGRGGEPGSGEHLGE